MPITIDVESPVARRGTNHAVTEVGLGHLLVMMRKDYVKATSAGHHSWVRHGLGAEGRAEIFDFNDRLKESYWYEEINIEPDFTDADFSPKKLLSRRR